MMYSCENCGHLFEEGEQARWTEEHGEEWDGCPLCRGSYEEVHQCDECGDWHYAEELYSGWCGRCLQETINYDTFFEYCEANKDENYLDTFVMQYLLFCDEVPKYPSYDFHKLMIFVYQHHVESIRGARAMGLKPMFDILEDCVRFVMEDDGECGRQNYADWLNSRKEVK